MKIILSLILLLPYRAPLANVPHLLPHRNGDEPPLLPHLRERDLKYLLIGASAKVSSISSFSYSCPKDTVNKPNNKQNYPNQPYAGPQKPEKWSV